MNVVLAEGPRDGACWRDISDDAKSLHVGLTDLAVWRDGDTEVRVPIARYVDTGTSDVDGWRVFRWESTTP